MPGSVGTILLPRGDLGLGEAHPIKMETQKYEAGYFMVTKLAMPGTTLPKDFCYINNFHHDLNQLSHVFCHLKIVS